jgi:hypothetical protein
VELEGERRPVALGFDDRDVRAARNPGSLHRRSRPGMEGEDDAPPRRGRRPQDRGPRHHRGRLAILLPVDRREQVGPGDEGEPQPPPHGLEGSGIADLGAHARREVLHQVADERDAPGDALRPRLSTASASGRAATSKGGRRRSG